MEGCHEHRALDRETELAPRQKLLQDLTDAQPMPEPAEQEGAANAPGLDTRAILTLSTQDDALPGKAPHGGQQAVQVARRENGVLAAEVANDALLRSPVLAEGMSRTLLKMPRLALLVESYAASARRSTAEVAD